MCIRDRCRAARRSAGRICQSSDHRARLAVCDRLRPATAAFSIVVAQVSINAGAALGKGLFPLVGPEGVAALRTGLSALILIAIARPWRTAIEPAQWVALGLYGLSLGGMSLLIYWAIERIPIGIAVAIEICGPLAVVLMTSRSLRDLLWFCLLYTSPSPRDRTRSRMPSSA